MSDYDDDFERQTKCKISLHLSNKHFNLTITQMHLNNSSNYKMYPYLYI